MIKLLKYAFYETRNSRGRLIFSLAALIVGTAAFTAVRTASEGIQRSMAAEAKVLLGGDINLQTNRWNRTGRMDQLSEQLLAQEGEMASVYQFVSMLYIDRENQSVENFQNDIINEQQLDGPEQGEQSTVRTSRLVVVRSVEGSYPLYGSIRSEPETAYQDMLVSERPLLIADPGLKTILGISRGDMVRLGQMDFEVAGFLDKSPGGPVLGIGAGLPVFISGDFVERTGLMQTGSRIRYHRYFRMPEQFDAEQFKDFYWDDALAENVTIVTYAESAASMRRFLGRLTLFLGLAGMVTLLLAGMGAGSTIHLFMKHKVEHAAIFRSLGATSSQVFQLYLFLAIGVGLLGSFTGALFGSLLPGPVLSLIPADLFPFHLNARFSLPSFIQGMMAGLAASVIFTLYPVLKVRHSSPLRVLRSVKEERISKQDLIYYGVSALSLFILVILLSISSMDQIKLGIYFIGAVSLSLLSIYVLARILMNFAKRFGRKVQSYTIRQGIANLHRPDNQTFTMLVSSGMGALLILVIFLAEGSFQRELAFDEEGRPNVYVIDIQQNQKEGFEEILSRKDVSDLQMQPLIAVRLKSLNGEPVDQSMTERDAVRRDFQGSLATREYFSSFRRELKSSEHIVAGSFWNDSDIPESQELSVEEDWAETMNISVGDSITVDVQGLPLEAKVTSIRNINWSAMELNSMLLYSPGMIESAPRIYVASFRMEDERARLRLQDELVSQYSNLSVIDVHETVESLGGIIEYISMAVRGMAAFTIIAGLIIITGSISAGRFHRMRQSVLLKVIGAGKGHLLRILITEYTVLGFVGSLAGSVLAFVISFPVLTYFFESPVVFPVWIFLVVIFATVVGMIATAFLLQRSALHASPLPIIREEG